MLSSLEKPEVYIGPVTVEQYASELPNLTQEQLNQITHPETLDRIGMHQKKLINSERQIPGLHVLCLWHVP